jgi:hypothetical protein
MKFEQVDRNKLIPLLEELSGAVEDLLVTGLTTASDATVKTLNVSFQESSRMGLLRLGGTLRSVNDEVARYAKNDPDFSRRRLSFFLNRAWALSNALKSSIEGNRVDLFERLMRTASPQPLERVEVVTVGVVKRPAASFVAFEFRLRTVSQSAHLKMGERLVWSCVFPKAPASAIPAEGYLHLPQKQKFKAVSLLEPRVVTLEKVSTTLDPTGCLRVSLSDASNVAIGQEFSDWSSLFYWDQEAAFERVKQHEPGPFDLDVELQEEVFFDEWAMHDSWEDSDNGIVFPFQTGTFMCEAIVPKSGDNSLLLTNLSEYKDKKKPGTLYGLMHYERCKLVLQPLTIFGKKKPKHLMISDEKIDPRALLSALRF